MMASRIAGSSFLAGVVVDIDDEGFAALLLLAEVVPAAAASLSLVGRVTEVEEPPLSLLLLLLRGVLFSVPANTTTHLPHFSIESYR